MEPEKNIGGRPPIEISVEQLELVAESQATYDEIAAHFGLSSRQFTRRMKTRAIAEAVERGRMRGNCSVRQALARAARAGNVVACIWYGKQYMGQRDITASEVSGPAGAPIEVNVSTENARDKLARLLAEGAARIAERAPQEPEEGDTE